MTKKIIAFWLIICLPINSLAFGLIRDAEIENTLKTYSKPIFTEAGLNPDAIKIYIVNDPSINAFVAGGQNLFIHTGLILECKNANMLIGVIAHETGHIAGGHIVKLNNKIKGLSTEAILAMVLGAAVSVAGLPDAGMAVLAGGQHIAQRNFLSFSREQEVEADQYAINYLHKTNQSAHGLLKVMEMLRKNQTLDSGTPDPYAISHPLSQDRIGQIRAQTTAEKPTKESALDQAHNRMVAKLFGFLEKPENTLIKYSGSDISSKYAKAIAYYKKPNLTKALAEVDGLLKLQPKDPFFNELKGQFLAESGRPKEALEYYKKANDFFPTSALLKIELGKLYSSQNNFDSAIIELNKASKIEPANSEIWRLLAVAYGAKNNQSMANLMLAEEALTQNEQPKAKKYAELALAKLPKNSPALQRANDILFNIKIEEDKNE